MEKKENFLWWNSYHCSPDEINACKNLLKYQKIEYLISIRDPLLKCILEHEKHPSFYKWYPDSEPAFETYMYDYEDALKKISFICELIEHKRKSMYSYCVWSPVREKIHNIAEIITEKIKENRNLSYEEIIAEFEDDEKRMADDALVFLIESGIIERKGNIKESYWIISKR